MGCRRTAGVVVATIVVCAAWGEAGPPAAYRSTDAQGNVIYSDRPRAADDLRAPAAVVVDAALVDELFQTSGVDRRLPGLAAQVRMEFQRHSGFAAAADRLTLSEIVARQITADALYPLVRDEFLRTAKAERARDALAWYRSPFGRRVVGLEVRAAAPESQREFRSYTTSISSNLPGARVVLVRRLDDASRVTETGLDSLVGMLRGFATAVDAARPVERRMDRAQIEAQLKQTRDQAFGPTRQGALVAMLFTYRDLSDAELARYVSFLESPTGRWFTRLTQSAFLVSLDPFDQPRRAGATTAAGKRPNSTEAVFTAGPRN